MSEVFIDALTDSIKVIPLLLLIYIGIGLVEYKFGNKIRERVQKAGTVGPLIGALAGSLPQCGFSVVSTALYVQKLVTIGTLLAVYLSTSDEAVPIILSQPERSGIVVYLIITKIFIALIAGYAIDFIFKKKNKKTLAHIENYAEGKDESGHDHSSVADEAACCGHNIDATAKEFSLKKLFLHPIIHTAKIFVFIFIVSLLLNLAIFAMGEERLADFLLSGHIFFQPVLMALIGLIPNCAASVAITQLYLKGLITYGSVIAGLCSSGGLGILILFREEKERRNVFIVLTLLLAISIAAGLIIQFLSGFFPQISPRL
jgi:hypothetical protein